MLWKKRKKVRFWSFVREGSYYFITTLVAATVAIVFYEGVNRIVQVYTTNRK